MINIIIYFTKKPGLLNYSSISEERTDVVVGDRNRGWTEGSILDSYNAEVLARALHFSLDISTLSLIQTF